MNPLGQEEFALLDSFCEVDNSVETHQPTESELEACQAQGEATQFDPIAELMMLNEQYEVEGGLDEVDYGTDSGEDLTDIEAQLQQAD